MTREVAVRGLFNLLLFCLAGVCGAESLTMGMGTDDPLVRNLFQTVYRHAGVDLEVKTMPPLRVNLEVDLGDQVGYLYAENSLAQTFKTNVVLVGCGPEPMVSVPILAWVRKADATKIGDRRDWAGMTVGVIQGFPVTAMYADRFQIPTRVQAPGPAEGIRMLSGKRFDLFFAPKGFVARYAAEPVSDLVALSPPIDTIGYWHALPAKFRGTDLEARIRAAFLKDRELIQTTLRHYMETH